MHTKVTRSLPEPRAFLREAPICKMLVPKFVPIRPIFLPKHGSTMTWHHTKFHDFQACFGFTRIKKASFSMFPTQPRRPEFWISFPFLAWNLEIYPRTHMWFFNQLWCTRTCACISNLNYAHKGDTFPSRTMSLLERSSDLQEAYTKICSYSANFFTTAWYYHDMTPCQVSWF